MTAPRLHIDREGGLTIFPIGLKTVPKRWRVVRHPVGRPTFEPTDRPLVPHLIEEPIRIEPDRAVPTSTRQVGENGPADREPQ